MPWTLTVAAGAKPARRAASAVMVLADAPVSKMNQPTSRPLTSGRTRTKLSPQMLSIGESAALVGANSTAAARTFSGRNG